MQLRTAIGSIGRIQQSGRIVLRVSTDEDDASPPGLLQEAVFNVFRQPFWTAFNRDMQLVAQFERSNLCTLNRNAAPRDVVSVVRYTTRGEVNLALPAGTILIDGLDAMAIETNRLGAARAIDALKVAAYEVRYGIGGGFAAAPEPDDIDKDQTQLAPTDRAAINQIARRLKLTERTPEQALNAVRSFFLTDFTYSTFLQTKSIMPESSPLAAFLLEHRTGHCEYFATATVHLLRAAGVPTRYAVGYAVQEKNGANQWIVRSRHAHAWALAWIDDRWQEVDNTPGNWNSIEEAQASFWEPVGDWFSGVWLSFNEWRQGDSKLRVYVFSIGILVLGFMAWRQVSGRRWRRSKTGNEAWQRRLVPGLDSDFY
ncbi:MAG TPA: transglutaminase-like domain-containing protein, partial [Verrucomicrobiae bacterium]|nr:transglutaminase-like domain-containing protein [Verrucomicrobiae bacterium]